jgi:hypothetical protein
VSVPNVKSIAVNASPRAKLQAVWCVHFCARDAVSGVQLIGCLRGSDWWGKVNKSNRNLQFSKSIMFSKYLELLFINNNLNMTNQHSPGLNNCFLVRKQPNMLLLEVPNAPPIGGGPFNFLTRVAAPPIAIISPRPQRERRRLTRPTLLFHAPDFHNHHD